MAAKRALRRPPTPFPLCKIFAALLGLLFAPTAAAGANPAPGAGDEALAWALLAGGVIRVADQRAAPPLAAPRLATPRLAALSAAAPPLVAPASPASAAAFVAHLHGCAIAALGDRSIERGGKKRLLRKLLRRDFDLETIARFVLGRHGRKATGRELGEYLELFEARLVESHYARLSGRIHHRLEIVGGRKVGKRDIVVATELLGPQGARRRVEWRVRGGRQGHKIVDVIVEGVSMAIAQRAEVASVMRANGGEIEGLLRVLRARVAAN